MSTAHHNKPITLGKRIIKLNQKTSQAINQLSELPDSNTPLTLTHDEKFQLSHHGQILTPGLTLTELRTLSKASIKMGIVKLVDVSMSVLNGQIKQTDAYIVRGKGDDKDTYMAFLHLLSKVKWQKPGRVGV